MDSRTIVTLIIVLSAGIVTQAADGPELLVPRAAVPPKIDGRLDDACWQVEPNITEFRDVSRELKPPSQRWVAWVRCDDEALYIATKCWDDEMGKVPAFERGHDARVWRDDCIEVFVMPGEPYYYHLIANLTDGRYDARHDVRVPYADRKGMSDWDGAWRAAGQRAADHWTMELAIPFAVLELGPERLAQPFRLNVGREQRRLTEFSCWPASGFHEYREFAVLRGLRLDRERYGLRLSDVSLTQKVPASNRFTAGIAEDATPGAAMTVRVRTRTLPAGETREAAARIRPEPDAKLGLDYVVPLGGGQVEVVAECLDPKGRARTSLRKVFYPPPILDARLDMPLYYQGDGGAQLAGRVAIAQSFLAKTKLSLALLQPDGERLKSWPLELDTNTGRLDVRVPLAGLSPGRYAIEIAVQVAGVTDQPETARFPFRVVTGPFD